VGVYLVVGGCTGREDAVAALKESVKLDNPSDWQLLVELTSGRTAGPESVSASAVLTGGGVQSSSLGTDLPHATITAPALHTELKD
jgi:hypothetical protein